MKEFASFESCSHRYPEGGGRGGGGGEEGGVRERGNEFDEKAAGTA